MLAYPDIKEAMYTPLADIATELLVPNIDLDPAELAVAPDRQ